MSGIEKYDSKYKLVNISKDGWKMPGEDADEEKRLEEEFKNLTTFLKEKLLSKVDKVVVSSKLLSSPSALVATSYGPSANMERVAKAQALGAKQSGGMKARKVMEINPRHPIVIELNRRGTFRCSFFAAVCTERLLSRRRPRGCHREGHRRSYV